MSSTLADDAGPSAPITQPLSSSAEAPISRPSATTARRRLPWWHLALRAIKGLFLIAELCAVLFLAAYAGLFQVLPHNPPALHVLAPGHDLVARQSAYCWLTPGRAVCDDYTNPDTSLTALPLVTAPKGEVLRLTMAYPAPTRCVATTSPTTGSSNPLTQALANASSGHALSAATYRLGIAVQPGTYHLTIACQWAPDSAMRWLRGLGASTYDVALRVVAH